MKFFLIYLLLLFSANAFNWTSTFNQMIPSRINAYSVVDAQVSYEVLLIKMVLKLGASNLVNNQVFEAYGSPSIGAINCINCL
jgi:hypothetical protein